MVKIAIAGPGQVAREIIDGLLATGKHEIVLLSRKDPTTEQTIPGTTWVKVDYQDRPALVRTLQGVHTVLSFIVVHLDPDSASQKALIDAAIEAGVKRIAPSEWAVSDTNNLPWYEGKVKIREYLEEKNRDKKAIEYTLFQPGWFLNYIAGTRQTAKHVTSSPFTLVDHENFRARYAGSLDKQVTYTAVHDVVNIVVMAVDYEGEWPTDGSINGNTLSVAEEIALGEKVRGKPYEVKRLEIEDLKAGVVKSWLPVIEHPSLQPAEREALVKVFISGVLLNFADGSAPVSDGWNRIFPHYKFTTAEEFLVKVFSNA
ncbi:hypothetical protein C8A01DRAFT_48992 [Parachaetomium inaequale]|uniref:NmrA-like domain-containing protein n=1 Tax=Parachaetomium inaequale TaxID=2588326 RepID=A0AAN6PAB6_9PEZI|nr:hypothetical protein C8A01DRAFT_48992 [Parachaetomium inaequale]